MICTVQRKTSIATRLEMIHTLHCPLFSPWGLLNTALTSHILRVAGCATATGCGRGGA